MKKLKAKNKSFRAHISDDGKMTIQFGDGATGNRLHTGKNNIRATYRSESNNKGNLKVEEEKSLIKNSPRIRTPVRSIRPQRGGTIKVKPGRQPIQKRPPPGVRKTPLRKPPIRKKTK